MSIHIKSQFSWIPALVISLVFFIYGLVTLGNYGINWDAPYHYQRGNAYVRKIITGDEDYSGLSKNNRRSVYQDDAFDYNWVMDKEPVHHAPLGGMMASVFNALFFRILGIVDDIDSYHLFTLTAGSMLTALVGIWASQVAGKRAGFASALSLSLYPLLLGERMFNFKDPPEAFWFVLTIYLFWLGITHRKKTALVVSAISCGFALLTKINIVFAVFIIVPWLIGYFTHYVKRPAAVLVSFAPVMLLYPFIVFGLFIALWPYLWTDTIDHIGKALEYYIGIATGISYQDPSFYFLGFNTYPFQYWFYTTPLVTLLLTAVGIFSLIKHKSFGKEGTYGLWLLLFLVPILRVTVPGMGSYGGVRQILEFSAGMALLSGLGFSYLISLLPSTGIQKSRAVYGILLLLYFPVLYKLVSIHPNENLYFNELIGGLSGAKERNFPGWDQSFGNIYYQGIKWVNEHAEEGARIAYPIQGTHNHVSVSKVRSDISLSGWYWSGSRQEGEYIIEPNIVGNLQNKYSVQYERTVLKSVHEVTVDGVPLLAVYKNDPSYLTRPIGQEHQIVRHTPSTPDDTIELTFLTAYQLTRLDILYDRSCAAKPDGRVVVINKDTVTMLPEPIAEQYLTLPEFEMGEGEGVVHYFIPLLAATGINLQGLSCAVSQVTVYGF